MRARRHLPFLCAAGALGVAACQAVLGIDSGRELAKGPGADAAADSGATTAA